MRPVTESELAARLPTPEQVAEGERRTEEFLAAHPDTDAKTLAAFGDKLDDELGIPGTREGLGQSVLDPAGLAELRGFIQKTAHEVALHAGTLLDKPRVGTDIYASLTQTLEARVTAAVAAATAETLSDATTRTIWAHVESAKSLALAQEHATDALDQLTNRVH
jgi:hypothetical protein